MTNEKLNNSKARVEQVASTKPQTLKLGLDVHAESIVVVRMVDHSAPQPAQRFHAGQVPGVGQRATAAGVDGQRLLQLVRRRKAGARVRQHWEEQVKEHRANAELFRVRPTSLSG